MTSLTFAEALMKYPVRARERKLSKSKLNNVRREAKDAAHDLVAPLRALSRREQITVAETLIEMFLDQIKDLSATATRKAFNPNQPRDKDGKWTISGMAGAAALGAGKLTVAAGGVILRAAQNALSTVTLIPSTKRTAGEAVRDWWSRINSSDSSTHIKAVEEAGARVMITIILGAAALALAHAFIGSAAGSVGAAIGAALRVLLGR